MKKQFIDLSKVEQTVVNPTTEIIKVAKIGFEGKVPTKGSYVQWLANGFTKIGILFKKNADYFFIAIAKEEIGEDGEEKFVTIAKEAGAGHMTFCEEDEVADGYRSLGDMEMYVIHHRDNKNYYLH